ncbi:MAG: ATP-binding protein, partial [Saprospiraceae bacterium]
ERMVAERTEKIRSDKQLIEQQAEQLRELDELKSRFFTNISHELRTPLTLILGPLESVLKRNRLENRDFTLLSLMQQNGRQLLKRINELLDLSSLDANKLQVEEQPVALYAFVKKLLSGFESAAGLKKIRLSLTSNLEPHAQVLLDAGKLEKIITNFLSNAIKFTPPHGQVKLEVTRRAGHLQISVSDTGQGIPAEDLERIFERFYQSAQIEKAGGTGIGLALCRELAKLMDGRVWAESELGNGSTFYLQLPLVEAFGQVPAAAAIHAVEMALPEPVTEPPSGSSETILVVEDNPSLLDYIKIILEKYRVITAENGQEALDKLSENPSVSLIISDIMMPVMDGFELLKTLKADDNLRHIPVIMLTARQKLETKLEALRIGVDDYMVKPFQEAELLTRVENLIKNSRGRLEASADGKAGVATEPSLEKLSAADLKWLTEVEKIIFDNIGNTQFSIGQLAGDLAMSTRRFQQKIKSVTGLTPKEYQREIQLEYARRLLESGDCRSISELSYMVGFKDAHYFSTLFQKRYGKRPGDYQ